MFKRIFGKPDEEPSGLNVGRLASSASARGADSDDQSADLPLPSRKPPPKVEDLVLPETLAEEATHPREVDVRDVLAPRSEPAAPGSVPAALSDTQLEAIAQRVADKLAGGVVGDRLREAVARIVSETSERLIREEIARIRSQSESATEAQSHRRDLV